MGCGASTEKPPPPGRTADGAPVKPGAAGGGPPQGLVQPSAQFDGQAAGNRRGSVARRGGVREGDPVDEQPQPPKLPGGAEQRRGSVRRTAVSAETTDETNRALTRDRNSRRVSFRELHGKPLAEKAPNVLKRIAEATYNNPLFVGMDDEQRNEIHLSMVEIPCETGEEVITQGNLGTTFYIVDSGEFSAHLRGTPNPVAHYKSGNSFGELALMYNCPRAASVKCDKAGVLWGIDRKKFSYILMSANQKALLDKGTFLKAVDVLSKLTDRERETLASQMEEGVLTNGEILYRKGEEADCLYLIKTGEVEIEDDGSHDAVALRRSSTFSADLSKIMNSGSKAAKAAAAKTGVKQTVRHKVGDFIGIEALSAIERPRDQTTRAVGEVVFLKLYRASVKSMVMSLPNEISRNSLSDAQQSLVNFAAKDRPSRVESLMMLEVQKYSKGQVVRQQGSQASTLLVIRKGKIKISVQVDGVDVPLSELGPGDYFGEESLVRVEEATFDATAVNETEVVSLDRTKLNSLFPVRVNRRSSETVEDAPDLKELTMVKTLGVGGYGRVKLAHWKETNTSYALKMMSKKHILSKHQTQHVEQERHLLGICDHPFLLKLCGAFQDSQYLYLLFNLIQGGELFSVLADVIEGKRGKLSEPHVAFYSANVALALEYLHDYFIAYRDLKPENLLIDKHGYLKIVDFGFAKIVSPHQRTWTICGTPEYLAPEVILRHGHTFLVDWWCLGVLTYELIHLQTPFIAVSEFKMFENIVRRRLQIQQGLVSHEGGVFIDALLTVKVENRLGCDKAGGGGLALRKHAFFEKNGIDTDALLHHGVKPPFIPVIKSPTDGSNFDDFDDMDDDFEVQDVDTSGHFLEFEEVEW